RFPRWTRPGFAAYAGGRQRPFAWGFRDMAHPLPALSLTAVPGRRLATLELAGEIERRGYAGIYCPSGFGGMALCEALAFATSRIPFGSSIAPIYARTTEDF